MVSAVSDPKLLASAPRAKLSLEPNGTHISLTTSPQMRMRFDLLVVLRTITVDACGMRAKTLSVDLALRRGHKLCRTKCGCGAAKPER
jgi:hypothetical protein